VAERGGRLVGVLGLWDLHAVRRTTLLHYPWWSAPFRTMYRLAARRSPRFVPLPEPGGALKGLTVTDLAVADDDPGILRRLLARAVDLHHGTGAHVLQIGFGRRDPLRAAVHGLFAQRFASALTVAVTPADEAKLRAPGALYLDLPMI
jgi:hypothetical protein